MKKEKKTGSIIVYTSPDGTAIIDVNFEGETVWLNQNQFSELFEVERSVITKHINNIINNGELTEKGNVQKMHFTH